MKKFSYVGILLLYLSFIAVTPSVAQNADGLQPLVLSDAVLPAVSKDLLLDPRIFNPEFYRKFDPGLALLTDQEATQQWTSAGDNHCLRGSFFTRSRDFPFAR